jgi:hypothetical protein
MSWDQEPVQKTGVPMKDSFSKMYAQLARTVLWVLYAALAALGLTLIAALLGLPNVVVSFRGVSASLGAVFVGLFLLLLLSSLTATILRRLKRGA